MFSLSVTFVFPFTPGTVIFVLFLFLVKKGKHSPIFLFYLFVCLFVFRIVPLIRICVALERPSWSYGARVGRASKDKCDQAFIPLHPFLRGFYPLLAINSPKNSKWGRRIIIQIKIYSIPICCYFSSNKSTCFY